MTKKHEDPVKVLHILGTRGIPAKHGGFETFAENFSTWLVKRGWKVIVYCQGASGRGTAPTLTSWAGVDLVTIYPRSHGALATIEFDLRASIAASRAPGDHLLLGYNTAVFLLLTRLSKKRTVINMDGVEWKRAKWSFLARSWFWLNEALGARLGDVVIADSPGIKSHLSSRGLRTDYVIPYGAAEPDVRSSAQILRQMGLVSRGYYLVVARPEPENSILEIVRGFEASASSRVLVVLGRFDASDGYHAKVIRIASDRVQMPGAIYDPAIVGALRAEAAAYVHGHQVGGTNPSLVEALAAGRPVFAHDNVFNRWTAPDQVYFASSEDLATSIDRLESGELDEERLAASAVDKFRSRFTLEVIHEAYLEALIGVKQYVVD